MLENLRASRKKLMPPSAQVVVETWDLLGYESLDVDQVRANFNELLYDLFIKTLDVLESHEQKVDVETLLPQVVQKNPGLVASLRSKMKNLGDDEHALAATLSHFLQNVHPVLKGYYLSIAQSRKQRGGQDFQLQVEFLLKNAAIPYEKQATESRVDFLLPSKKAFEKDRPRSVVLSLKRTLRERWKQVASEIKDLKCPNTYLVTTEKITPKDVDDIKALTIYFVVWDSVKRQSFPSEPAVVGFSKLIGDIVGLYMPQWPPNCLPAGSLT